MKNFIQAGRTLAATLAVAVTSGQLVLLGNTNRPAIASGNFDANTEGVYYLEGVYELTAAAAAVGTVGDAAYWDSTAGNVTATAAENTLIGIFSEPKVANATLARVRLPGA
ncbi:DUF2190 family protein [Pararobbsia silviterrae]|uniref:DUF2190 family protein n=2 Tax=Pararobbsia silviterrae TaxID=1792498 RepID=A0A494X721_9BURK|nr:DUF2190 family protein [Pararobbsia silviterrae]